MVTHVEPDGRRAGARSIVAVGALAVTAALSVHVVDAAPGHRLAPDATQPQQNETFTMKGPKSTHRRSAQSDPALLGRTDAALVAVLVRLDYDAVVNYEGGVPGLAATSPEKTGRKLAQNKAAVDAYTRYVIAYESKVLDRVKDRIPAAKVGQSYRTIYGGVAMTLPANRIADLLSIEGVLAVQTDSLERPLPVR